MLLSDGIRPRVFFVPILAPDDEGAVKVGNGGDIQGIAGQGTRVETAHVMSEMGDYRLDDFLGKLCDE